MKKNCTRKIQLAINKNKSCRNHIKYNRTSNGSLSIDCFVINKKKQAVRRSRTKTQAGEPFVHSFIQHGTDIC